MPRRRRLQVGYLSLTANNQKLSMGHRLANAQKSPTHGLLHVPIEFLPLQGVGTHSPITPKSLHFDAIDTNHDGVIDRSEWNSQMLINPFELAAINATARLEAHQKLAQTAAPNQAPANPRRMIQPTHVAIPSLRPVTLTVPTPHTWYSSLLDYPNSKI